MDPTKRQGSLDGSQPERAPAMSSKFSGNDRVQMVRKNLGKFHEDVVVSSGLARGETTLQFLLVSPKYAWYMDAFGIFPCFFLWMKTLVAHGLHQGRMKGCVVGYMVLMVSNKVTGPLLFSDCEPAFVPKFPNDKWTCRKLTKTCANHQFGLGWCKKPANPEDKHS